jgi:predicted metal-dependent enzyme (double-stranded beta helix superfamily)
MSGAYTLNDYVTDLRQITREAESEDEIITRVGPLAQRLALDKTWLQQKHYEANPEQGFGTFLLHEEPDHSLAVLVVNWLPGRGAPPHDHGTWAVVSGVEGLEKNISYRRIDDRARPDFAELEVKKETVFPSRFTPTASMSITLAAHSSISRPRRRRTSSSALTKGCDWNLSYALMGQSRA